MRFLVVEDDAVIAGHITGGLAALGFAADHALTGAAALRAFEGQAYDGIVLDRLLPDISGFAVLDAMRERGPFPPVLMLSALSSVRDRIDGLDAGADDYLTKPFEMEELAARLNAIARRVGPRGGSGGGSGGGNDASDLTVGRLTLDPSSHSATFGDRSLQLNRKLYSLLAHMMRHADRVVTRDMLLEHVWGYSFAPSTNIVESNISRLRTKLQELDRDPIETLRGSGYVLRSARCQ